MQGRPKSGPEDKFRLNPVAPRLSELLGKPVSTDPARSEQPAPLSCGSQQVLDCDVGQEAERLHW